jgi:DNA replication protein DnaC
MLTHPTIERLEDLRFTGMAKALREQMNMPEAESLSFDERLGLLIDREATERENRQLKTRLKKAKLRQNAAFEDIDYVHRRGLDKKVMLHLASCDWVTRHHNVVITGPTGAGKSFIACALAHKACLEGFSALYQRLPRLAEDIKIARGDGRYLKLLTALSKTDVLVLDDWGLCQLQAQNQRDLLELLDDRHMRKSTIITSQLPVEHWHEAMADPTLADAMIDRIIHNAHHLKMTGESMRKKLSDLDESGHFRT